MEIDNTKFGRDLVELVVDGVVAMAVQKEETANILTEDEAVLYIIANQLERKYKEEIEEKMSLEVSRVKRPIRRKMSTQSRLSNREKEEKGKE